MPTPEATATPEVTATPAPETTDAPVVTVTPAPETTITPEATATPAPEPTIAPEVTATPAPETTITPGVTATPAPEATMSPTPEPTIAPEVTVTRAPETINESDATAMPALEETIAPEATETPMPENADAVPPFSYEDSEILLTATSEFPIPDGVQLVVQKLDSSAQPGMDGLQGKRALESYRVSFQLDGAEVMGGTALELRLSIKDLGLNEALTYLLDGGEVLWQKAAPGQTETIVFSMPSGGTFTFAQDAPLNASLQYEDDLLRAEVTVADAARIPAGASLSVDATPSEYETYAETLTANGIGANRVLGIYGMTLRLAGPEGPLDLGGIPLSVRLTYKGLSLDGGQAWILDRGGAVQAEVTDGDAGCSVTFELSGEASFAVVFARPVNNETVYTFEDDTVKVIATLSDPSAMPHGASLQVSAVDAQPYAPFCEAIESEKGEGEESANAPRAVRKAMSLEDQNTASDDEAGLFYYDRRAYDIRFVLDGLEYEPSAGTVGVSIHFKEDAADAPAGENLTEVSVVHLQESNGEVTPVALDAAYDTTNAGSLASVSFETDSFSVYLITNGYTKSSALTYNIVDTATETFTNTPYYYANRKLGIAGSFHLVAFNSLTLSAHTNGNVLAKSLTANVNFGTNGLANELSYVQNYAKVNGVSASSNAHVLALGSGVKVSLTDNGNAFAINGTKLDRPKNVWQDNDTAALPFINLASVKSECQSISSLISGYANANVTASLSDMNNRSLTLTAPTGVGVYNFTAAQVNGYASTDLKLMGFTSGNSGSMIINVNCSGVTSLTLPNVRMFVDGTEATTSEVTDFANGRVLWNFYNISGLTINAKLMKGSILAPGATVNLNQNLNGTVVADTITVYAESHREDFVGKISDTVTVRKVWKDALGNTLTGTGIDQSSVTVQLYKKSSSGTVTAHGSAVVLNSANSWKYSWSGLDSGYTYYAQETYVGTEAVVTDPNFATQQAAGTIVTYANNAGITNGEIVVTNQKMATTSIVALKVWQDESGAMLSTPPVSSVSVSLYRSTTTDMTTGVKVGASQTLDASNSWMYTFTGLDARYSYYVREDASVTGYMTTYSNTLALSGGIVTVTNRKIATTTITVEKLWKNADGSVRASNLPASITVELYKSVVTGGVASPPVLLGTHVLTASENWTFTWTELNATDEYGNPCQYYVREVAVTGFVPTYSSAQTAQTADGKTVYLALNGALVTVTNKSDGTVQYIQLPLTGGTGTNGYAALGSLLCLLAAALFTIMLSRERRRKHVERGGF